MRDTDVKFLVQLLIAVLWLAPWILSGWWSAVYGPRDPIDRARYRKLRAMRKQMDREGWNAEYRP